MLESIVEELEARVDQDGWTYLDDRDVDRWAARGELKQTALMNEFGLHLAREFEAERLSFAFCDSAVNWVWGVLVTRAGTQPEVPWPNTFHEVYEAFDAGVFRHTGDPAEVDPVQKYTRPAIREVLAREAG